MCFFFSDIICFSWNWERRLRSSSYDGKNWNTGFDHLEQYCSFCQSVTVLTSPAVCLFWEYWKYIRYCKRREKEENPPHGHATSNGQQTNRRPGSLLSWANSVWIDSDDEEMRWSPSMSQRERWHWFKHDGTQLVSLLNASGFPCAGRRERKGEQAGQKRTR